jgi:conjugative transposon TraJ protein
VLAILGPIAFAISVYDGFQATMTQWITRYVAVYFWLPVSDLFSCILARIQVLTLQRDIAELASNPHFSLDASNTTYIIFMLIGIVGYFTVPTVANWIIASSGIGGFTRNLNKSSAFAGGAAGAAAGNIVGRLIK